MVLTEDKLKSLYKKEKFETFTLEKGTIMTPSARQFLLDKNIVIVKAGEENRNVQSKEKIVEQEVKEIIKEVPISPKYVGIAGECYFEKPEHMTQIHGNILVKKDDKRILFRGKLDTFASKWLVVEKEFESYENEKLNSDMESIAQLLKELVKAEVLDIQLKEVNVLGETLEKIKEISHNPKKYYGMPHLFDISAKNLLVTLKLNELRGLSRELEVSGVTAFSNEKGIVEKSDILKALNRLSSAIYVMMLKSEKGEYTTKK